MVPGGTNVRVRYMTEEGEWRMKTVVFPVLIVEERALYFPQEVLVGEIASQSEPVVYLW